MWENSAALMTLFGCIARYLRAFLRRGCGTAGMNRRESEMYEGGIVYARCAFKLCKTPKPCRVLTDARFTYTDVTNAALRQEPVGEGRNGRGRCCPLVARQ